MAAVFERRPSRVGSAKPLDGNLTSFLIFLPLFSLILFLIQEYFDIATATDP